MQKRAAIWILRAFKILLSERIEAIAGIIPIKFYLQKLTKRSQIHPFKLSTNHILRELMNDSPILSNKPNSHAVSSLTNQQKNIVKDHLIDICNKTYSILPLFSPLNPEFFPGFHIMDNFSDHFFFNLVNKKEKEKDKIHTQILNEMVLCTSSLPHTALVVIDASIKNNIATSISHVHIANHPLTKTVHHATFITSMEAELFAIRCSINQACIKENVSKIIIVTDSIHTAKKIFDSKSHLFQSHTAAILSELQGFFNSSHDNSIEFWECPSRLKWRFHKDINKDSKSFYLTSAYPCKISWDYCKKTDSDNIINQQKMTFLLWDALDMNNFYFLFSLFSDFIGIFVFFFLSFGWWRGTWHCSHMTCHMMWHHRPRRWWKDLEDDIRAHAYNIVTLSKKWGEHEVEAWTIGQV